MLMCGLFFNHVGNIIGAILGGVLVLVVIAGVVVAVVVIKSTKQRRSLKGWYTYLCIPYQQCYIAILV